MAEDTVNIDVNARVQQAITGFAKFTAGVTAAWVAVKSLQKAMDFTVETAKMAADLQRQEMAFRVTMRSNGIEANSMLRQITAATRGTVKEFTLMQQSSQAALLGLPLDKLPDLFEVARVAAVATGRDIDDLVSRIVNGIGRQSVEVLDELGIRATGAIDAYAKALGKSTQEMTASEKQMALMVRVLEEKERILKTVGPLIDEVTEADKWNLLAKEIDTAKRALGEFLQPFTSKGLELIIRVVTDISEGLGRATTNRAASGIVDALLTNITGTRAQQRGLADIYRGADWETVNQAIQEAQSRMTPYLRNVQARQFGLPGSTLITDEVLTASRVKIAQLETVLAELGVRFNELAAPPPTPPGEPPPTPPPPPPPAEERMSTGGPGRLKAFRSLMGSATPGKPQLPQLPGRFSDVDSYNPMESFGLSSGFPVAPETPEMVDKTRQAVDLLTDSLNTLATSAAVDSLVMMAQALGQGAAGAGSLAENLAKVGAALTADISKLAFRAALTVLADFPLTPAKWATAAALAVIGGVAGIASGAMSAKTDAQRTSAGGGGGGYSTSSYDRGSPAVIIYSPTIVRGTNVDARRGLAAMSGGARFER